MTRLNTAAFGGAHEQQAAEHDELCGMDPFEADEQRRRDDQDARDRYDEKGDGRWAA